MVAVHRSFYDEILYCALSVSDCSLKNDYGYSPMSVHSKMDDDPSDAGDCVPYDSIHARDYDYHVHCVRACECTRDRAHGNLSSSHGESNLRDHGGYLFQQHPRGHVHDVNANIHGVRRLSHHYAVPS